MTEKENSVLDETQKKEDKVVSQSSSKEGDNLTPSLAASKLLELKKKVDELEAKNKEYQETEKQYYSKVLNDDTVVPDNGSKRSIDEITKEMADKVKKGCSNLDYIKLALELNDRYKENNGKSVFLPKTLKGKSSTITREERENAQEFEDTMKELVKEANGDSKKFNRLLEDAMEE